MSRGLFIGGLAVGGGLALAALAFREREPIRQFVVESAAAQVEGARVAVRAAKKGVIKMTDAAQAIWSKLRLPSEAAQNITKYHLGDLVDKYRGPIPKWMVMGIIHTETGGTFDPNIYNIRGTYEAKRWVPGTPMPTNSWAHGLFQILRKFTRDNVPKGKTGYDIEFKELFDPEKNIYAGLKMLKFQWDKRVPAKASDADKLALLYFSHNQGGPTLGIGLSKAKNKLSAGDVIKAAGASMAGKPLSVALATATRGGLWEQLGALGEGSTAQTGAGGEALPQPAEGEPSPDELLVQIQNAEMERDLDKAADLEEQLDDLLPDDEDPIA
jgi:hypothetical protein